MSLNKLNPWNDQFNGWNMLKTISLLAIIVLIIGYVLKKDNDCYRSKKCREGTTPTFIQLKCFCLEKINE